MAGARLGVGIFVLLENLPEALLGSVVAFHAANSSVVDENVQPARGLCHLSEHGPYGLRVRHIASHSSAADLIGGGLGGFQPQIVDEDLGAFFGKAPGDLRAESACRPGDERSRSIQSLHGVLFPEKRQQCEGYCRCTAMASLRYHEAIAEVEEGQCG